MPTIVRLNLNGMIDCIQTIASSPRCTRKDQQGTWHYFGWHGKVNDGQGSRFGKQLEIACQGYDRTGSDG